MTFALSYACNSPGAFSTAMEQDQSSSCIQFTHLLLDSGEEAFHLFRTNQKDL